MYVSPFIDIVAFLSVSIVLENEFYLRHEVGFHENIKKEEISGGGMHYFFVTFAFIM